MKLNFDDKAQKIYDELNNDERSSVLFHLSQKVFQGFDNKFFARDIDYYRNTKPSLYNKKEGILRYI